MDSSHVRHCRDICNALLTSLTTDDWQRTVPDIGGSVGQLVGHITQAMLWYSIDLAAEGTDLQAIDVQTKPDAESKALLEAFVAVPNLLAAAVDVAREEARGFHPWGMADRSGFAAMACDEMLIHTYDIALALAAEFEPPAELAAAILNRLFPGISADPDPWTALKYANGRIALDGHPRLTEWRWHCAPLNEWDGG